VGSAGYTRKLHQLLKKAGCTQVRPGGKHEIWQSPITGKTFTMPRNCKVKHTANNILKDAGIDERF
jgi:predicted RNA binding protein YcfA (HicA-like mRNA interferase family)